MSIQEFSLRLQHGIQGGFAPPTPEAIHTVALSSASPSFLSVASAVRSSGSPSLTDLAPKEVPAKDNEALITELHDILKSIPTEQPPGSEDIYGLDISIAWGSEDLQWMNAGPEGCGGGPGSSSVQATDEDKAKFKRAVDIVNQLTKA